MKLCACGCGEEIPEANTWVRGHHRRGPHLNERNTPYVEVDLEELEVWTEATGLDGLEDDTSSVEVNDEPTSPPDLKVHIYPSFGELDKGDGGIRRVVEGQLKHLPKFGIQIVETAAEADVIAYHATVPSSYVKLYPEKTFVSIVHGLYWSEYEWDNWSIKANNDVMEGIRVSDLVVACSEWVANAVRRHTSRDVVIAYHGIDANDWQAEDTRDYVLWNKTRPDPVCDPLPMNQVASIMPNTKFISTFGEQAPNVALTGKLNFEEAKTLIKKAGVYLCTTRETFGIGTLEAMACGVPIVGFNFGGQAEFVEHKVDGWLVNPGDIEGLKEGIEWAFANRATISPKCIAKAKKFTWERACALYAIAFDMAHTIKNPPGPRTSVVVTNYNLHDYLEDCLNSVASQSDPNWECIVVDDASPNPRGREIVEAFAAGDDRFKLVTNVENVYLAEARNIGIRVATGRYVLPLDADDMLAPDAVSILADALDGDRSIQVTYGNVRFVDEDGVTPTDFGNPRFPPGYSPWPFPFVHEHQIAQMNLLPYASMYRRRAWEQTGGYRRRQRTAEDADLWTRFSSYGFRPKLVTDVDTLVYRNRKGSMSRAQGEIDWTSWYSWAKVPDLTPAGAGTRDQLPVHSCDPILISVVIPVGPGHERYIHDAVDSVDAQFFRYWECIVVNDTGKPLPELPAWVRVFETEGGTGTAHARNVGIAMAKGRLFLPLDADDYLEPNALNFMYDAYRETHNVIYTDFYQTDQKTGKEISIHHCDDYDPYLITGKKRTVEGQIREGMIHSVTALTPVEVWKKVGGYDESLPAWEDWDFQLSVADIGVCSTRVSHPLFVYRKHTGLRRLENYEAFEKSKEGILRKWSKLWEGGKELMACGSCRAAAGKSYSPMSGSWGGPNPQTLTQEDAVLLEYTGNNSAATPFRGTSKTMYWFANGEQKYVLNTDVSDFLRIGKFKVVQAPEPVTLTPALVAEGPPA